MRRQKAFQAYVRLHHMCHGCRLRPECKREVGECARADVAQYSCKPTLGGLDMRIPVESAAPPVARKRQDPIRRVRVLQKRFGRWLDSPMFWTDIGAAGVLMAAAGMIYLFMVAVGRAFGD